ncbi:hypothetical protein Cgig2_023296 [Carnegiea gigantea]|uniref:DUF599 domain-containing protein n=1 Tax=Carnegiea gigantea TaxID=171969 RepID=A0A9Q1GZI5_9CARY|nr:hypothetical protein Cgig2_023296 [Carnegiea gigantea]
MEVEMLDFILVPLGLMIMATYHLWLLHEIIKKPAKTIVGIHAINRRLWVQAMMEFELSSETQMNLIGQDTPKNGVLAVQTLRNNIMASTLLASTAITLSSVIAVLMTSRGGSRALGLVFGDQSQVGSSLKFFSILVCFLLAFLLNVQSIRYYSHASILINVPFKKMASPYLTADYVGRTVNRGGYFWSLGLRAFYFSLPLFLWIFGPIPMLCSCLALVFLFYFLDFTLDFGTISDRDCVFTNSDEEQAS